MSSEDSLLFADRTFFGPTESETNIEQYQKQRELVLYAQSLVKTKRENDSPLYFWCGKDPSWARKRKAEMRSGCEKAFKLCKHFKQCPRTMEYKGICCLAFCKELGLDVDLNMTRWMWDQVGIAVRKEFSKMAESFTNRVKTLLKGMHSAVIVAGCVLWVLCRGCHSCN